MKYRFLILIILAISISHPLNAKFYIKRISTHDRMTKYDLEQLCDGKRASLQHNGCDVAREENGTPTLFLADPSAGRFEFIRYRVVKDADDTMKLSAFGEWGKANNQYRSPSEIMIYNLSDLYILDTGNDRIGRAIFDLSNYSVSALPPIATGVGLKNPQGFDVVETAQGIKIYVADTKNHRIVKLSAQGNVEQVYGSHGSGVGQFRSPYDIARYGDFVYIADTYNKRIVALLEKENGTFEWWDTYSPSEQFPLLVSVACDANGNVFCVDQARCRVIKLTEGLEEFLWSIGTRGILSNQYLDPRSISVSKEADDVTIIESYTEDTGIRFLGNRITIPSR